MSLVIADEEFERGAKRILDMSDELTDIFRTYSSIIQELLKKGICDTAINNVLTEKLETLEKYAKDFVEISTLIVDHTKTFLTDIDEADAYLYD